MKTNNPYLFETLDYLISYPLNPDAPAIVPVSKTAKKLVSTEPQELIELAQKETIKFKNKLQHGYFSITDETEAGVWIMKLYDALIVLMNRTFRYPSSAAVIGVMDCLQDIRSFFQVNYSKYLTPDQCVPLVETTAIAKEIQGKRDMLIGKLRESGNNEDAIAVVLDALDLFVQRIPDAECISLREVNYHKAIVKDIEEYKGQESAVTGSCPSLHELLVYWNLNSKACIRYFTAGLESIKQSKETIDEQLEFMRFQSKNIGTMAQIPDFIYNPGYPPIKEYFIDYVNNEIAYLEHKKIGFLPNESYNAERNKAAPFKILCAMSSDQIALFLRAVSDLKIILARSLTSVFKSIIPFLSTNKEEALSPNSVRIASYHGEQRDKDILVDTLQKIIDTVKSY